MIEKSRNKKPIFLLILLMGFSLVTVKIVRQFAVSEVEVNMTMPQECENCDSQKNNQLIEDIPEEDIVYLKQEDTVSLSSDAIGTIKGVRHYTCGAIPTSTLLASIRKTCSNGSGQVDFSSGSGVDSGEGVLVTKDSKVVITEITYPLSVFLGQSTYQDSNKQIRKDSPESRSNGQQIDVEYVTRNLSPKESEKFSKSLNKTERVPFEVEAEIKLGGAESITSSNPGEYTIRNAPHNPKCKVKGKPCPRELAISDFNVEKTNKLASDSKYGGYLMGQAPGGDHYENKETKSCLVEDENYTVWDKGVINACDQGKAAKIGAIFKEMFSSSAWKRCTVGEEVNGSVEKGTCIGTRGIGIKMTPIFGDPYECTDDLCGNAMLTDRYRSILSPQEADGLQEVSTNPNQRLTQFIATDCAISIDGVSFGVYCLWDASMFLSNYQMQAATSAPHQEDFPENFNVYWKSVKKSSDISAGVYGLE